MQATVLEVSVVSLSRTAQARVRKAQAEGLCVACMTPLDKTRTIRGCHERCYRATTNAIRRNEFTERSRVQSGKLLPKEEGGRRPSNPVTIEAKG